MSVKCLAFLLMASLLCVVGCTSSNEYNTRLAQIADPAARRVINNAVKAAGGWNNWQDIQRLSYVKKSILYREDGTVESEVNQTHRYILKPALKGSITWRDSSGTHEILYSQDGSARLLNGQVVADSEQAAYESFMSAAYVLFMPFKLLDPGTTLTYKGLVTLDTGQEVETIQATYNPSSHDNHSTSDVWYFYFDKNSGQSVANMVYHAPTYAYIENNESTDDYPIRLHTYRESWRSDGQRNKQFLRGVFFYGDYVVE